MNDRRKKLLQKLSELADHSSLNYVDLAQIDPFAKIGCSWVFDGVKRRSKGVFMGDSEIVKDLHELHNLGYIVPVNYSKHKIQDPNNGEIIRDTEGLQVTSEGVEAVYESSLNLDEKAKKAQPATVVQSRQQLILTLAGWAIIVLMGLLGIYFKCPNH